MSDMYMYVNLNHLSPGEVNNAYCNVYTNMYKLRYDVHSNLATCMSIEFTLLLFKSITADSLIASNDSDISVLSNNLAFV